MYIGNEFGKLRKAIVNGAENLIDVDLEDLKALMPEDELKEHPETRSIRRDAAIEQVERYHQLLSDYGVVLDKPPPSAEAFIQVFTRDPSFVVGEMGFVSSMRDAYRIPEMEPAETILREYGSVVVLGGEGANIEGGDVIVLKSGSVVLVGTNRHSTPKGIEQLRRALQGKAEVVTVPHRAIHLDCCVTPLPNGEALIAAQRLPSSSIEILSSHFSAMHPMDIHESERELAANIVWLDQENVIVNERTEKTNAMLQKAGYRIHPLNFNDLVGLWGSFRCAICPIERSES